MVGKKSQALAKWALGAIILGSAFMGATAGATEGLWSGTKSSVSAPENTSIEGGVSASGIEIGGWVNFRGVGNVFYAGRVNRDIYFSHVDEPGGFDWVEAINACRQKGNGWQLPTRDQLNLLYINSSEIFLSDKGINATSGNWYWTSSSINEEEAWRQRFYDGFQQPLKKKFAARVRCVRAY